MLKRFKNKRVDGNWLNTNFPCMMACPAHTNAGRYVELIAEGRFEEAYRLAAEPGMMGYAITIFEQGRLAGGMLYLGIPEYRLQRYVVEAQVREILETGDITLKLNHAAGRDFMVSDLRKQGFDAVLVAVGAHRSRDLSIPGVDLDGVHKGIDFMLNVNLG